MLKENENYIYRDISTINLKEKFSNKEILSAYVKALFYENQQWIKYLEKEYIKERDIKKFKKLISKKSLKAREKYFETGKGKLNTHIKLFIDKYKRFLTHSELYAKKEGSD